MRRVLPWCSGAMNAASLVPTSRLPPESLASNGSCGQRGARLDADTEARTRGSAVKQGPSPN